MYHKHENVLDVVSMDNIGQCGWYCSEVIQTSDLLNVVSVSGLYLSFFICENKFESNPRFLTAFHL